MPKSNGGRLSHGDTVKSRGPGSDLQRLAGELGVPFTNGGSGRQRRSLDEIPPTRLGPQSPLRPHTEADTRAELVAEYGDRIGQNVSFDTIGRLVFSSELQQAVSDTARAGRAKGLKTSPPVLAYYSADWAAVVRSGYRGSRLLMAGIRRAESFQKSVSDQGANLNIADIYAKESKGGPVVFADLKDDDGRAAAIAAERNRVATVVDRDNPHIFTGNYLRVSLLKMSGVVPGEIPEIDDRVDKLSSDLTGISVRVGPLALIPSITSTRLELLPPSSEAESY